MAKRWNLSKYTVWRRRRFRTATGVVLALVVTCLLAIVLFWDDRPGRVPTEPQTVVKRYITTVYARDYSRAYDLLSASDKAVKTRTEYVQENGSFDGATRDLARRLATYIEFQKVQVERRGDRAKVSVTGRVPDGNADVVREILYADPRRYTLWGGDLPAAKRTQLLQQLERLHESGQLPMLDVEQHFEVVRERSGWRIFENWAAAVRVHFSSEVKDDLPWEFKSDQTIVLAKPGELLQSSYRAENLSDQEVTAKARERIRPEEYAEFLYLVQCFCFIQETLGPGERTELPLAIRIAQDLPDDVTDLYVHYELYPIASFPDEDGETHHSHTENH